MTPKHASLRSLALVRLAVSRTGRAPPPIPRGQGPKPEADGVPAGLPRHPTLSGGAAAHLDEHAR